MTQPMQDRILINGQLMHYTGYDTDPNTNGWLMPQRKSYIVDGAIYSPDAKPRPMPFEAMLKTAHDSGDGETIYHCPFCGSGQVIARSDRTIECSFCHTCFTVQVQPQYSAFPQTVNGVPVDVPGMPGQVGQDPTQAPPGADPGMDPNADPNAAGGFPPGGDDGDPDADPDDDGDDDDSDGGNPFAKKSFRTASGRQVSQEDYLARLALAHTDDRNTTLAKVRENRGVRRG